MAQFGRVLGSGPRGRRFKSSYSDQGKTKAFCLRFLLQEEDLKGSEVNDSLGRLSEPSVTERRRAARIKSSHSDQGKTKAFCLRFLFIIGECRGFSADYAKKAGAEKFFKKVLTNGLLCDSITSSLYHAKAIKQ